MKRLTIIILVYLCLYGIAESADYGIPVNFAGSVSDSVYSNFYMIDYSQTGGIFTDSASNGYYFVNQGYIPYLDAGFSPNNFFVLGKETFITNRNEVSPETAAFKVLDFDSSPVKYASLEFSIADKPANSTGDSYYFTETNDSGEAYLSFKTGDKTGAYIVKAYYRDAGTKYISYNTDETEIPAKQWRMIGLNKTPVNSSVNSAFSGVIPEYIYRWNPETEEHEFHSKYETVKNVNPGEGYFTVFPENTVLSLNGNYITDTFPINLKKGWNQIGNPYYFVSDWNSSRIQTPDNRILTVSQAETEEYIFDKIFWYKDGNYYWGPNELIPAPQLYAWTGFWIEARRECSLLPSPVFLYSENRAVNLAPPKKSPSENWEICVSANGAQSSDKINYFGTNESAEDIFDNLDVKKAPAVKELMQLSFGKSLEMCRDVRKGPVKTYLEWQMNLRTGQNASTALKFSGISGVPEKYDIYLVDTADNTIYNLRENPVISAVSGSDAEKKYRVLAGYPEYVKAALAPASLTKTLTYAHPNPGPGTNGKIQFRYNISAASQGTGKLTLKIFDLGGVKVLEKELDTNAVLFEWDCRNDKGKSSRTGVYVYILEYDGPNETKKIIDKFGITR